LDFTNLIKNKRVYIEKAYRLSQPNTNIKLYLEELKETNMYNPNDLSYYFINGSNGYWTPGKPILQVTQPDYCFEDERYDFFFLY
jgi:hypothetical protein